MKAPIRPPRRTSSKFFAVAALFTLLTTIDAVTGRTHGRLGASASFDPKEAFWFYLAEFVLFLVGIILRIFENKFGG